MLKKIVLWGAFAVFVGVLVLGAVNRTSDRLSRTAQASTEGNAEAAPGGGQAQRGQGNGIGRGQGQDVAVGHEDCEGKGKNQVGTAEHEDCDGKGQAVAAEHEDCDGKSGASPGGGAGVGIADHVIGDWTSVQGTVTEVDELVMVVDPGDGSTVVVEGRPWTFAREQGFVAQVGDQVTVTGFHESGEFKAGTVEDASNGLTVVLRDETGRPGWAGRGWRAGQAGAGQ